MIAHTITFNYYKIEVIDMELRWCSARKSTFLPEDKLRCKSEIVSLFPYQDHLYISTLNGCVYLVCFPLIGDLYLERFKIVRSEDDT